MGTDSDRKRCVLFVDDDAQALRAVQRMFVNSDIVVDTALNADVALERLENKEYHVVMSDYSLPGMDGIRFLGRLNQVWPDTVKVLITGHANVETAMRAINRVGIYRFLTKPWSESELRATLRAGCAQFEISYENRALALKLDQRNRELRRINDQLDMEVHRRTAQMLVGLLNALDHRDTETQGHSVRVGLYTRRLAEEFGLHEEEILDIERGALLHDIGKIGVSDTILLKPGKLSFEEWEEMRRHTIYGFEILQPIEFLEGAASVVRSHHERYDGEGYPDRISGDDVHLGARLFSVIDTYDAITSDRPYRKALSPDVAREEILKHRGSQYHPDCVDAFLRIPQQELDMIRGLVDEHARDFQSLEEIVSGFSTTADSSHPPVVSSSSPPRVAATTYPPREPEA